MSSSKNKGLDTRGHEENSKKKMNSGKRKFSWGG